ncbi:Gypsy retrotransposon integrase-like protein 1, partial [Dictyocoela muelleri]
QKAMNIIIKNNYYIPKAKEIVKQVIISCLSCQRLKRHKKTKVRNDMHILPENHNELVSSDILGPLKREHFKSNHSERYLYIVTFTDIYSKWTEIKIIWNITSNEIIKAFKEIWIKKFGPPKKFLSDQGR